MNYSDKFGATSFQEVSSPLAKGGFDFSIPGNTAAQQAPSGFIKINDSELLFSGQYKREGSDLIISNDVRKIVVPEYFKGEVRPTLTSPDGATLSGKIVDAFTGHVTYAQAGTPEPPKEIGSVVKLTGSATAIRNGVAVELNIGDKVYKGDVLQSAQGASLAVTFVDGTVFNLSSNARMVLNEMVYDPNGTSNSSLLSLVQGTITFVAGQTAKNGNMRVDTPVATMGIRGTAVLVEIGADNGPTKFSVLVEPGNKTGSFNLYDKNTGSLIGTVSQAGQVTMVTPTGIGLQATAVEIAKTQADLAFEKLIIQQVFPIFFPNYNDASPKSGTKSAGSSANNLAEIQGPGSKAEQGTTVTQVNVVTTGSSGPVTTTVTVTIVSPPIVITPVNDFQAPDGKATKFNIADQIKPDPNIIPYIANSGSVTGATTDSPIPSGFNLFALIRLDSATGEVSYNPEDFRFLGVGEEVTYEITFQAQTGPFIVTKTLPFDVDGLNDAPIFTLENFAAPVNETTTTDSTDNFSKQGTLTFNDADFSDVASGYTVQTLGVTATGKTTAVPSTTALMSFLHFNSVTKAVGTTQGVITETFTAPGSAFDYLAAGETVNLIYQIKVTDAHGATRTATLTVTITGTNDAPTITGATTPTSTSGDLSEDGVLTASGVITFRDVDLSNTHTAVASHLPASGSISSPLPGFNPATSSLGSLAVTVNENPNDANNIGTVTWVYSLDNLVAQRLAKGQIVTQTFTVTITDSSGATTTQPVTVTITGTNDVPEIVLGQVSLDEAGEVVVQTNAAGTIQEPVEPVTGTMSTEGIIVFKDVDLIDTHTATFAPKSSSADADLAGFNEGLGVTDGEGAVSYIGTFALGNITESTIDLIDLGAVGWTFTIDKNDPTLQSLSAGQTITQVYTITIKDSADATITKDVTVTITGTNDAPVVGAAVEQNFSETTNSTFFYPLSIAFTDVDLNDTGHAASITNVVATGDTTGLALDADGLKALITMLSVTKVAGSQSGTLNVDFGGGPGAFDYLGVGDALTLTYTIRIDDGDGGKSDQTLVVNIAGTNDAPVIDAIAQSDLTEAQAGQPNATSLPQITFTDVDLSDVDHTAIITDVVVDGEDSGLTLDNAALKSLIGIEFVTKAAGSSTGAITLSFSAFSVPGAFDYLAANDVLSLTYTVQVADGDGGVASKDFVVTITGANDAPVLTAAAFTDLTTITENDDTNSGQTVASFIGSSITDADRGAVEGIAITGAPSSTHGHWEFSIDGGQSWAQFGTYSASSALLLNADDIVRFVPNGEGGGIDTFTYVAWDRTTGAHGTPADTTTAGGTSAFSTQGGMARIEVTAVDDEGAPIFTDTGSISVVDTAEDDIFEATTGQFAVQSPPESGDVVFSATDAMGTDPFEVEGVIYNAVRHTSYGDFLLNSTTGEWRFEPDDAAVEGLVANTSFSIKIYAANDLGMSQSVFWVNLTGIADTPDLDLDTTRVDNDALVGAMNDGTPSQILGQPGIIDRDGGNIESVTFTLYDGADEDAFVYSTEALNALNLTTELTGGSGQPLVLTISGPASAGVFLSVMQMVEFSTTSASLAPRHIEVIVDDGFNQSNAETVVVEVEAAPNSPPEVTAGQSFSPDENTTFVGFVEATDSDVGPNNSIVYSLDVGVEDNDLFAIDPETGELSFINAPDYETDAHQYTVNVRVSDGNNGDVTSTRDVTVSVTNVNDTAPTITLDHALQGVAAGFDAGRSIPNTVLLPNLGIANDSAVTVEFWLKDGLTTDQSSMLFGFQQFDLLAVGYPDARGHVLGFNTGNGDLYGVQLPLNFADSPHHIAAVFSTNFYQSKLYIDGVLQQLTDLGGYSNPGQAYFTNTPFIGGWGVNPNYSFQGQMDDVRIWHGERSQADIAANKDGLQGPTTSLVANYQFEQVSDGPGGVIDSSVNGHHGTLSEFTAANNIVEVGQVVATEDQPLVFSVANDNAIKVADVDGGNLMLVLSVSHGSVTLHSMAGLTVQSGANGSASVTVTGSAAALNSALDGLIYTGAQNYNGSDQLQVVIADGIVPTIKNIPIDVRPVNDAPVLDLNGAIQAGTDFQGSVTNEGFFATTSIGPNSLITDADAGIYSQIYSATITIENAEIGDFLSLIEPPFGISFVADQSPVNGKLTATISGLSTLGNYQGFLNQLRFGTNSEVTGTRDIKVTVNDGQADSNAAFAHIEVTQGPPPNDPPVAGDDAIFARAEYVGLQSTLTYNDYDTDEEPFAIISADHDGGDVVADGDDGAVDGIIKVQGAYGTLWFYSEEGQTPFNTHANAGDYVFLLNQDIYGYALVDNPMFDLQPGHVLTDTFHYTLADSHGNESDPATVTVTIDPAAVAVSVGPGGYDSSDLRIDLKLGALQPGYSANGFTLTYEGRTVVVEGKDLVIGELGGGAYILNGGLIKSFHVYDSSGNPLFDAARYSLSATDVDEMAKSSTSTLFDNLLKTYQYDIHGSDGADVLIGGNLADRIDAGASVVSQLGAGDQVFAGGGNDLIIVHDDNGWLVDGGAGIDTLRASGSFVSGISSPGSDLRNVEIVDLGRSHQNDNGAVSILIDGEGAIGVNDLGGSYGILRILGDAQDTVRFKSSGDAYPDSSWMLDTAGIFFEGPGDGQTGDVLFDRYFYVDANDNILAKVYVAQGVHVGMEPFAPVIDTGDAFATAQTEAFFFEFNNSTQTQEFWKLDGSGQPVKVADLPTGLSVFGDTHVFNGKMYFTGATSPPSGLHTQIYSLDANGNIVQLSHINESGSGVAAQFNVLEHDGELYLSLSTPPVATNGYQQFGLYKIDAAGNFTAVSQTTAPGDATDFRMPFEIGGTAFFFEFNSSTQTQEFWKLDGSGQPIKVSDLPTGLSLFSDTYVFNGKAYFTGATSPQSGLHTQIYSLDANGNIVQLSHINESGAGVSAQFNVLEHDGELYFSLETPPVATNGYQQFGLYKIDAAGNFTAVSPTTAPGDATDFRMPFEIGGTAFFFEFNNSTQTQEFWKLDGSGQPIKVSDLPTGLSLFSETYVFNGKAYFTGATSPPSGLHTQIYSLDANGNIVQLSHINESGTGASAQFNVLEHDGELYFSLETPPVATNGYQQFGLYKIDAAGNFTAVSPTTAPGDATDFRMPFEISGGSIHFGGLHVSDDADEGQLFAVDMEVGHGSLSGDFADDLQIFDDGSDGLTFGATGTLSEINEAIQSGITYTPTSGEPDKLTITVSDETTGSRDITNFIFVQANQFSATLTGTMEKDIFIGSINADQFVFAPNSGRDVITNFQANLDHIDISQIPGVDEDNVETWLDSHVHASGANDTLITFDQNSSILVKNAHLTANDFILHPGGGVI